MKICLSLSLLVLSLVVADTGPEMLSGTTRQDSLGENAPEILSGTTECWTGSPMGDLAFRLDHWGTSNVADSSGAVAGLQNLLNFYSSNCQDITQFYVNGNIVGASFAGQMIQNHAFAVVVIQKLIDEIKTNGISSSKFIQYCPGDPAKSFGIILDTTGNIGALRSYVKSWSKGRCVSSSGTSSVTLNTWSVSWLGKSGNAVPDPNLPTCDYVKVVSGKDTAAACGITGDAIQLYNPGVNFSLLQPGQPVCCSVGKPPDLSPKPNPDGSCSSYQVIKGDSCSALAAANTITIAQIETFNKNTYGWLGCNKLQEKMNICLSSGTAPKPTPNPEAECGMLAPGDKFNSECPLKACCSSSGFCGLDDDHCKIISSPTGAPGTNGCENGFDFDWEYPGAPDIPIEGGSGLVPYNIDDGVKYLSLVKELRAALPADKSISIAAPASYWYLKNFPIVEMSQYLDYIVYMTYDLHGQWDYGPESGATP
ncbi:hypothetical protein IW138_005782, partial [Coemansia sp. RSA 986]